MKTNLLYPFENIPYFTIEGFKQSSGIETAHTVRTLLHRWVQAGHLLPLKRGVYMTQRFYAQHRQDHDLSAAVSAILLPQSYLSLDYVLQEHNLLTEITYPVTCITPQNTRTITNALGTFWYRNLRADLYKGFTIHEYWGVQFARASVAKALFDFLYLRPIPFRYRSRQFNLAEELRLNLEELEESDWTEFANHVAVSDSPKMREILRYFRASQFSE